MKRKGILFSFAIIAVVLGLSSTAWACTVFKGKMTLKGNAASTSSTIYGNNTGMGHCGLSGFAKANTPGSVFVSVAPAVSSCSGSHSLPNGYTYAVSYISQGFNNGVYDLNRDCMWNGGTTGRIALYNSSGSALISVSGGSGSGTYNLPSGLAKQDAAPYEGAVCVSDTNTTPSTWANAAPVIIL